MRTGPTDHPRRLFVVPLALVLALVAAGCGGSASEGREPVVEIEAPEIDPQPEAFRTLEPGATPTPEPTPAPTPTPGPTPAPFAPPRGAEIRAGSGTQPGAPNSFCWSPHRGGPSQCEEYQTPEQPQGLRVGHGETVLMVLHADRAPDEESIRPFQGNRSGYPAQRIQAALETELTIELDPGDWHMDLCATWHGHGQPICWLFRLEVV